MTLPILFLMRRGGGGEEIEFSGREEGMFGSGGKGGGRSIDKEVRMFIVQ
jgi:hypothetical protein